MEAPVVSNDSTRGLATVDSVHLGARCRRTTRGSACARFGCAGLLLLAATLKAYQIFTDPAMGLFHGSHWLQIALFEYEVLLALWLLSNVAPRWGRRIALVTFSGFACYAFFLGISGQASCGCFGKVPVTPSWAFATDAALVIFLVVWKPQGRRTDWEPASGDVHRKLHVFLLSAALFAVVGLPALSIAVRPPGPDLSIESALANSPFVLLDPENWIGKPFPLTDFIDISERERLSRGFWIVVFFRHDCPKCQQALLRYERLADQLIGARDDTHIALIEIPPYGPRVSPTNRLCLPGRLNDSKEWIITTPAEVRVTNGEVIAANSQMVSESQ